MKKPHKISKTKAMLNYSKNHFNSIPNKMTRKAYMNNFRKFLLFCTSEKGISSVKEIIGNKELIQEYTDALIQKGLSASTVHTYIAPVCRFCGVNMKEIKKEKRVTAEYKRGRTGNGKIKRSDNDISNPKYAKSVEFQKRVGIRRAELAKLKGGDFDYDKELGCYYVHVKKGKGGKEQKQRILPDDVEFVSKYFDGVKTDEKIFSAEELNNKIDYHSLRAKHAKDCYSYYLEKLNAKDGDKYREELKEQIWKRMHHKAGFRATKESYRAFTKEVEGTYKIRGSNKKLALEHGLPTEYDKLATMAVSVFHLSHWRNDVTVHSYLLAY